MPRVTIWIRNEDYPKWQAIEHKPEWLHRAISSNPGYEIEKAVFGYGKPEFDGLKTIVDDRVHIANYDGDPVQTTYTPPEDTA